MNHDIQGDVLVIIGDLKPEVKFVSVEQFTEEVDYPELLFNSNKFYPRVLLVTASSIGAGLYLPDVYAVVRMGFLMSIFELAQEMGRCGLGHTSTTSIVTDNVYVLLACQDFVYLNT